MRKLILIIAAELVFMYLFCREFDRPYIKKEIHKEKTESSIIKPTSRSVSGTKLDRGNAAYNNLNFSLATTYYESYLKLYPNEEKNILPQLADCYWQMRDYTNALRVYQQLHPNGKEGTNHQEQFRIGELYARQGDYDKASQWLDGIQSYASHASSYQEKNKLSMMMKDSLNWKVKLLNFNTEFRDFCPFVVDSLLLFSSNRPLEGVKQASGWDGESYVHLWQIPLSQLQPVNDSLLASLKKQKMIANTKKTKQLSGVYEGSDAKVPESTISSFLNKQYTNGNNKFMGKLVSGLDDQQYNTGPVSVDKDGRVYFSANYAKADKKGVVRIKMMAGDYKNDGSIEDVHPLPLDIDKGTYSVMHPAVNAEGTVLIFSSDKPGGFGGYDLYVTQHANNKEPWQKPRLLGSQVNSNGNEVFPTITSDGYLYFSSDGRSGLGGLDIYRISLQDALAGTGTLEHLPYPINSSGDDFGWAQESSALQAYFTSDRITSDDNIYNVRYDAVTPKTQMTMPEKDKKTSDFQGYVLNRQTMDPMKNVTVFMLNKCSGKVLVAKTTENGIYIFPLIKDCDVVFKAVGPEFSTDCFPLKGSKPAEEAKTQKIPQDLLIDKYPENFKWKLKNIYYDFNQWNLRSDAYPVLDSLVKILKNYPIKVELSSHTDCRGSYQYNNWLSQKRAQSAVNYILAKGINDKRIIAKGYGKYQLVNRCADGVPCKESEHQANRRTEVKVLASASKGNVINNFDPSIFKAGQELDTNQLPTGFFRNDVTAINNKPMTKYELEKKIEAVAKENKSSRLPVPKKNITTENPETKGFSVQILAMKGTLQNPRTLKKLHNVFVVACADEFTRYLAGRYNTEAEANAACERIHKLGAMYKNAFVINIHKLKILSSSEK